MQQMLGKVEVSGKVEVKGVETLEALLDNAGLLFQEAERARKNKRTSGTGENLYWKYGAARDSYSSI
jgi:hypothetical protein